MSRDVSTQSDISKSKFHGADGSFQRAPSSFRNTLAPEQATSGRYHLYVSYACPWATRALIVRKLKGLDAHIGVTVVSPRMGEHGWPLGDTDPFPGADKDPHEGAKHVKDLYLKASRCASCSCGKSRAHPSRPGDNPRGTATHCLGATGSVNRPPARGGVAEQAGTPHDD